MLHADEETYFLRNPAGDPITTTWRKEKWSQGESNDYRSLIASARTRIAEKSPDPRHTGDSSRALKSSPKQPKGGRKAKPV
jgi:hypothetical protein